MSNSEAPISITTKSANGTLITVRANDATELDQLIAQSLASIESAYKELEGIVKGTSASPVAYLTKTLGATEVPPFSPAPIGGGRSCQHGKMTALQGPSKQGGVYKGYFCPSAQGDPTKCKTIYIQKHDPEWNTFVPDRIK